MNNIKTCADFTDDHCALHPQCHGCPAHIDEPKKCGECVRYEECSPYTTPDETFPEVGGCPAYKKPTNYDRIRNMSVEEMAELFLHNYKCNKCAFNFLTIACNGNCFEGITKWLKTEVME